MAHAGYKQVNIKHFDTEGKGHRAYGVSDAKGRPVGAMLTFESREVTLREGGDGYLLKDEDFAKVPADGVQYGFRLSGTRNGTCYGATARIKWFPTAEARDAAAAKAWDKDEKAKVKKFS